MPIILSVTVAPAAPNYRRLRVAHQGAEYTLRCFFERGFWEILGETGPCGRLRVLGVVEGTQRTPSSELVENLDRSFADLVPEGPPSSGVFDRYRAFCADVNQGADR